jgi:hypothetical protein
MTIFREGSLLYLFCWLPICKREIDFFVCITAGEAIMQKLREFLPVFLGIFFALATLLGFAFLSVTEAASTAGVLCVDANATGAATDLDWADACTSLQDALPLAASWSVYLPFVARTAPDCPENVLINGDFEQSHTGWYTYTTGSGWKQHDLIGSSAEGFYPYKGDYAARLGGYEGVWDAITQTVVIPIQGQLTYWWKGRTYETLPHHDTFDVVLLNQDGILVALLAHHDDQDVQETWQQDIVDVSAYAGQSLTLRFSSYNDNYYFSVFHLDEICLSSVSSR